MTCIARRTRDTSSAAWTVALVAGVLLAVVTTNVAVPLATCVPAAASVAPASDPAHERARLRPPQPRTQTAHEASAPITRETGFASAADGTRIYYEKIGAGPAIALIHGLGGNHAAWYRQVPALARDHTVIVLAQRGFAPSEGARDRFDVEVLVSDFTAVLDACGIEHAVVVGQSMGGWTALGAAIRHPERVDRLVLSDSIGGIFDDEIRAQYLTTVERARQLGAKPPPLAMHPALDPEFSRERPEQGYLYQLLTTFGTPPPGLVAQQLGAAEVARDALSNLSLPVLFVVGQDDPIFPPAIVRRAASYVSGARVVVIPGAGHSPYFEQPDAWRAALLDFLRGAAAHSHGAREAR